jgi:hypothetical protein
MSNLLITFGCSWTHGIGINYIPNMSKEKYFSKKSDIKLIEDKTFRMLLANKYSLDNLNFSIGGSSNQAQFRKAQEFFISDQFFDIKKQYKKIIVMWGITSVLRTEIFDKDWVQIHFTKIKTGYKNISNALFEFHNNEIEIDRLCTQMIHWNTYFDAIEVKNFWFDTFNTHNYKRNIPRKIFDQDLLTMMSGLSENKYHHSMWRNDRERTAICLKEGLINPYSLHPTIKGHEKIASFFNLDTFF